MNKKLWLVALAGLAVTTCAQVARPIESVNVAVEAEADAVTPGPHAVLVTLNGNKSNVVARPIDAKSLEDLADYPSIPLGNHHDEAVSPDGALWAVVKWPDSSAYGGTLHLVDLVAWEERATEIEFFGHISLMTFSPDGSHLLVSQVDWGNAASSADVMLISVDGSRVSEAVKVEFIPRNAGFSSNGETVYLYGSDADPLTNEALPPKVAAIRLADGDVLWSLTLDGVLDGVVLADPEDEIGVPLNEHQSIASHYTPGVVFSPDGRWLYVVHPEAERLTRVDLSSGRSRTRTIAEEVSLVDRVMRLTARPVYAKGPMSGTELRAVLSRHGEHLYVTGIRRQVLQDEKRNGTFELDVKTESLGLRVIDAITGRVLASVETPPVSQLGLSADGGQIYLVRQPDEWSAFSAESAIQESPGLMILDAKLLEPIAETEFEADWVWLAFTAGGTQPYLQIQNGNGRRARTTIRLLDADTGELSLSRDVTEWMGELVLPPT